MKVVADYLATHPASDMLFDAVCAAVATLGAAEVRMTKSQAAFWRRRAFAWVWTPALYGHRAAAPLVLSVALRRHDASPRWKEIVEPAPGRFMHHLELYSPADLDGDVLRWLQEAWEQAE